MIHPSNFRSVSRERCQVKCRGNSSCTGHRFFVTASPSSPRDLQTNFARILIQIDRLFIFRIKNAHKNVQVSARTCDIKKENTPPKYLFIYLCEIFDYLKYDKM